MTLDEAIEMLEKAGYSILPGRTLFASDPFCPACGHNRDKSSVSSINHEDGTNSCQMCGIRWSEITVCGGDDW